MAINGSYFIGLLNTEIIAVELYICNAFRQQCIQTECVAMLLSME